VHLASGATVGVEALVRWHHPTLGLLQPADFIPLTETTGAIVPLGRWILERACRDAARWADEDRFMGVNLSALQLVQPGFADLVASILESSGLAPHRLLLELTETTRLDQEAGAANLAQLERMGIRLAIDDFGTGWASFSQLRRIPFDIVKIDRSFVEHLSAGSRSESLISGIVDLARRLGVAVIAEGIETDVQRAHLQHLGATYGQGFHLARPMPIAKLRKHLAPAPVPLARTRSGSREPALKPAPSRSSTR
jgi:EAL domain-containing protein (putative c-di-GMP-specific phosphodiesterase class I)